MRSLEGDFIRIHLVFDRCGRFSRSNRHFAHVLNRKFAIYIIANKILACDLRTPGEDNAYRAVYTVRFAKAVDVLHCFQKKSPTGIKTAKTDVDLIHQRLKAAQQHYEEHHGQED